MQNEDILEFPETMVNEEITVTTVETVTNEREIELLTLMNDSLTITNTLILIIFIVMIAIAIYNLMWKFIKIFL